MKTRYFFLFFALLSVVSSCKKEETEALLVNQLANQAFTVNLFQLYNTQITGHAEWGNYPNVSLLFTFGANDFTLTYTQPNDSLVDEHDRLYVSGIQTFSGTYSVSEAGYSLQFPSDTFYVNFEERKFPLLEFSNQYFAFDPATIPGYDPRRTHYLHGVQDGSTGFWLVRQ